MQCDDRQKLSEYLVQPGLFLPNENLPYLRIIRDIYVLELIIRQLHDQIYFIYVIRISHLNQSEELFQLESDML